MILATLFNWLYLPQGVALYHSLARVCRDDFVLYVLCIDDLTAAVLRELKLKNLQIVIIDDIEDGELKAARNNRTIGEFCWTCTTPLLLHILRQQAPNDVITYVDADLYFYSDPSVVLEEMGGGSIYVHEHDFASKFEHLLPIAARFNVGLVSFRNNPEGLDCLTRWRAQCIQECVMDPSKGKCGDQNYLDEWPDLYPALVIARNPGVGLAPWNISKHRLKSRFRHISVDGRPVVFYHFHSLRLLRSRDRNKSVIMATDSYELGDDVVSILYRPYARELRRAVRRIDNTKEIAALGHNFLMEFPLSPLYVTV
jgi:hypothetical protein